mmetsp:Transcript_25368/g.33755  ORF Transcript_25368/g.33755 Transcript_25368/m.33755 type:complete len:101 (-) Transcript_25368:6-308(-)
MFSAFQELHLTLIVCILEREHCQHRSLCPGGVGLPVVGFCSRTSDKSSSLDVRSICLLGALYVISSVSLLVIYDLQNVQQKGHNGSFFSVFAAFVESARS